jgi:hypothetical protein
LGTAGGTAAGGGGLELGGGARLRTIGDGEAARQSFF